MPRTQAYRGIGLGETSDDEVAYANACQLERRPGIKARIEWLSGQDEDLIAEKRRRIEGQLWDVLEADIGNFWETYESAKTSGDGSLATNSDGKMLTVRKQRAKLINDLPPEFRKLIEDVTVDRNGNVIPKLYSKAQANKGLRELLDIGSQRDPEQSDVSRLSDAELIVQLAEQAKQLGVEINLNYDFTSAQLPPAASAASEPVSEIDNDKSGKGEQ